MNISELKKEIGWTVAELKDRFSDLADLNGATKVFWEKAYVLTMQDLYRLKADYYIEYDFDRFGQLDPQSVDFWQEVDQFEIYQRECNQIDNFIRGDDVPDSYLDDNNYYNDSSVIIKNKDDDDNSDNSDNSDLQAIIDHYGFVYVADLISWYEIEIGAKERSLANPKFWDNLQQAVNDGYFDDFSEQSIDKNKCPVDNESIVISNGVISESEYRFKNEAIKNPSAALKNHSEKSISQDNISGLIISFGWVVNELLSGLKSQTRRLWKDNQAKKFIKAFDEGKLIKAYDKAAFAHGKLIGYLRLTERPYQQHIKHISEEEVEKEGFPGRSPLWFIQNFFKKHKEEVVWVISFEFIPLEKSEVILPSKLPKLIKNDDYDKETNGQYLLFDYWCYDIEYPAYQEIVSSPIYKWPLNETLEKIKNLKHYWFIRIAKFVGISSYSLDYCKNWIVTFIKDKILNAKVRYEVYC